MEVRGRVISSAIGAIINGWPIGAMPCLSVNYRGSDGVRQSLRRRPSEKQHARKMHDDLIDMVDWAVDEGIAQKDRIAIFGVSYGGLAFVHRRDIHAGDFLLRRFPWSASPICKRCWSPCRPIGRGLRNTCIAATAIRAPRRAASCSPNALPSNRVENIKEADAESFTGVNDVRCKVAESDAIVRRHAGQEYSCRLRGLSG